MADVPAQPLTPEAARAVVACRRLTIPASALVLGLGGLIPFFASASVFAFGPPQLAGPGLLWLITYAAAVLSFLGGVRWGAEITRTDHPGWRTLLGSVLPALIACGLLAAPFATPEWQLSGFLLAYLGCWLWDVRSGLLPAWYERLRTLLTLGAAIALGVALEHALSVA
jgi:hypothetical protein